jgi:hypothetical protein
MSKKQKAENRLTEMKDLDYSQIVFSSPNEEKTKNGVANKRVYINYMYPDGSCGDLLIPTERLFSYGIQEDKDMNNKTKITGYSMPLCLWNQHGPLQEQRDWTDSLTDLIEFFKDHIVKNVKELGLGSKIKSKDNLLSFDKIMYWKMLRDPKTNQITDQRDPDRGPTLYPKLIVKKINNKEQPDNEFNVVVKSFFFDKDNVSINFKDLIGKFCYTTAVIKIESIFIGSSVSLQIKLYQANVEVAETTMKPVVMARPKTSSSVSVSKAVNPLDEGDDIPIDDVPLQVEPPKEAKKYKKPTGTKPKA